MPASALRNQRKAIRLHGEVWNDAHAGDPGRNHNAADLARPFSEVVGSIKPGKFADMIAVSGDPLQDISVLENVSS